MRGLCGFNERRGSLGFDECKISDFIVVLVG